MSRFKINFYIWISNHCPVFVLPSASALHQFSYNNGTLHYVTRVCLWLAAGRWFILGTPVSSTNKTDHDITEILLKMALTTITLTPHLTLMGSLQQTTMQIWKAIHIFLPFSKQRDGHFLFKSFKNNYKIISTEISWKNVVSIYFVDLSV